MISRKIVSWTVIIIALAGAFTLGTWYQGQAVLDAKVVHAAENATADSHAGHGHAAGEAESQHAGTELDWCFEHRVPESGCTLCRPGLAEGFRSRNDWCGEHGIPESHCRSCDPKLSFPQESALKREKPLSSDISVFFPENEIDCAISKSIIKLTSAETAARAGLTFESVLESPLSATIDAPAEVRLNATKTVTVTSTVPIRVTEWTVEPGEKVSKGQPIARISSPEIADLRARLIEYAAELGAIQKDHARKVTLKERQLIPEAEWIEAEASLNMIEARFATTRGLLISAGLSESDLDSICSRRSVSPVTLIRAPSDGILVEREAALGELMEPGECLAVISDPRSLWIEAKVGERDIWRVQTGQMIEFNSDGSSLNRVSGKVIWVAQYLDQVTRTGIVRAVVTSPEAQIYAGEFGRLTILANSASRAVLVPRDAVQWEGCCNVVFVKEGPDLFRTTKVKVVKGDNSHYRVVDGLSGGEWIVVNGSYLLKTELKKGSLGTGCSGLDAEA